MQGIIFSAYDYTLCQQRYTNEFYKYLDNLKKSEWFNKDDIYNYKNKKFLEIINFAYATVPFYKKFYNENGVKIDKITSLKDIKELPIVSKEMVRQNNLDFLSNHYKKSNLLKKFTSGTSGIPLEIFSTKKGNSFLFALAWRHKARFGIKFKDRRLTCGGRISKAYDPRRLVIANSFFANRSYINGCDINNFNIGEILDFLNKNYYDFYEGYPSVIDWLSQLLDKNDLKLLNRPKLIVSGSEQTSEQQKERWLKTFGARNTEHYANAEFAGCLSKCEYDNFHEDFECGHVETVKDIEDPEISKLILTGWGNPAMPFIRYEIGDTIRTKTGKCPCGRESTIFDDLSGREEDYIITPNKGKIMGLNQVFNKAKNVVQIQAEQNSIDALNLKVVPSKNFAKSDLDIVLKEFSRRSRNSLKINILTVDKIELPKGSKYKTVINKVKNDQKFLNT